MKMAVLLSGSGRTLDNFHERIAAGTMQGSIAVVLSNLPDALGLTKARNYGYPAFHAKDNGAINGILQEHGIELVLLAGYLKLYAPPPHLQRAVQLQPHNYRSRLLLGKLYEDMGNHAHASSEFLAAARIANPVFCLYRALINYCKA